MDIQTRRAEQNTIDIQIQTSRDEENTIDIQTRRDEQKRIETNPYQNDKDKYLLSH